MLSWLLKTIKLYTKCHIIAVVMGIILNIIGNFLAVLKSIIGKKLSTIGQDLLSGIATLVAILVINIAM